MGYFSVSDGHLNQDIQNVGYDSMGKGESHFALFCMGKGGRLTILVQ